jgi:hypothetical protein
LASFGSFREGTASPQIRYRLTLASFGALSHRPCYLPTAVISSTTPIIVASFRKIALGDARRYSMTGGAFRVQDAEFESLFETE